MRTVIAYDNGKPIWSDNVPANGAAGPVRPSGSLVTGLPDWRERKAVKKKGEA